MKGYQEPLSDTAADFERFKANDLVSDSLVLKTYFDQYNALAASEPALRQFRDKVILTRLVAYDFAFNEFKRDLNEERVGLAFGTDLATLVLGTLTTAIPAEAARTAFGATTTVISGGKASFDKQALFERTIPAIVSEMEGKRASVKADILVSMRQTADKYTLIEALDDLRKYEKAGSILDSIAGLTGNAAQRSEKAQQALEDIKVSVGQFSAGSSSRVQIEGWLSDGSDTVNPARMAKLSEWLSPYDLKGRAGVYRFLMFAQYEDLRQRALKEVVGAR